MLSSHWPLSSPAASVPPSSASSVASFSPPSYRHLWNLFLSLPVLLVLRTVAKLTPYARQGFFCNDNEIRYPYVPDTVPAQLLDWVFAIVAVITVVVSELTLVRHLCRRGRRRLQLPEAPLQHPVLLNCVYLLAAWLCSLQATDTIGDIGKRTCSRLRPNFLAVCQPRNLSALCPPNEQRYIADYECTNTLFDQNEYFSFPSGHASSVCNFTVFMLYYLQKRCKLAPSLRSFAQFFVAIFAYFVCLSRVRDHKHRLADVAGGALIGVAVALFFVHNVLHNFRPNRYSVVDVPGSDWADVETATVAPQSLHPQQSLVSNRKKSLLATPQSPSPLAGDYGSLKESQRNNQQL